MLLCIVFVSCGELYRGEYCEHSNPCRQDLNRCINGGTCRIVANAAGLDARCQCPIGTSSVCMSLFTIDVVVVVVVIIMYFSLL